MKVYLAGDHGGFPLKEQLRKFLLERGYAVEDLGPMSLDPGDDYPDFVFPLAGKVAAESDALGIVICRSGSGEVIAANKVRRIRATLSFSAQHARMARTDNDANILALPADYLNLSQVQEIAETFLTTPFSQAERHIRRLQKIKEYEDKGQLPITN